MKQTKVGNQMKKDRMFSTMPVERYVFEREQVGFTAVLSARNSMLLKGWEIQRLEDHLFNDMVFRISNMMAHGDKSIVFHRHIPKISMAEPFHRFKLTEKPPGKIN